MPRAFPPILALLAALAGTAGAAASDQTQAQVNATLRGDPQIVGPLMAAGIAAVISENCPTIDAREMRARADAVGLLNLARGHGFTFQQARAFVRDPDERAWMRDQLRAWFAARGLQETSPAEGFCALGQQEIASGAPSARYLRAR